MTSAFDQFLKIFSKKFYFSWQRSLLLAMLVQLVCQDQANFSKEVIKSVKSDSWIASTMRIFARFIPARSRIPTLMILFFKLFRMKELEVYYCIMPQCELIPANGFHFYNTTVHIHCVSWHPIQAIFLNSFNFVHFSYSNFGDCVVIWAPIEYFN